MNDLMQGRWTLLHVIGLVVWQKHVKSLSLSHVRGVGVCSVPSQLSIPKLLVRSSAPDTSMAA